MAALSLLAEPNEEQPQSVIDQDHLRRMTLGDRSLEREVLEIFARQTVLTLKRIAGAEPAIAAAAAHTLKGSARGIGAWRVVRAAEMLEHEAAGAAAAAGDDASFNAALAELQAASSEVCAAIGARLGAHLCDEADPSRTGALAGRWRDH